MTSFPNAAGKGVVFKKSVFERQKDEVEAKRARDEAETAAVYEDFVKSFEDDGTTPRTMSRPGHPQTGSTFGPGPGKRHFTSSGLKSGPGSLGPTLGVPKKVPGSLGHMPGYGKKRQHDDLSGRRDRDRTYTYNDREDRRDGRMITDEEDESKETGDAAAARPTLHLSNLPPGTSPAVIKALLTPSPLIIANVRILPGSTADRKALSALVTLAAETSATDIDTVVSHLQNRYLGWGFNLSISRHLSSAALTGSAALGAMSGNINSLPFGAKPVVQKASLSRAPPPGQAGRFAPPTSYTSSTPYGPRHQTEVIVHQPSDLKQLKVIHKTLESLLTFGPEFEALLMSRPQIQRDEKWAWLWDPSSQGGVYYRWRLWEVLTDRASQKQRERIGFGVKSSSAALFEGQSRWIAPEHSLKFEYTTKLDDFVSDEDYNSSEVEDDEEGDLARRHNDHNAGERSQVAVADMHQGTGYLNPLAKTKLMHLLSRLPDSNAKLRKGDVARITGFAIEHAGAGAQEVASLIARNVVQPFCHIRPDQRDLDDSDQEKKAVTDDDKDSKDTSSASMVGLFVISDILSASASAGVRHAWRYRVLFENTLRQQTVFERLGRIDKDLAWGKLKAEKWKRSVQNLLSLWEGWSVFPHDKHQAFLESFLNPPLTAKEQALAEVEEKRNAEEDTTRSKSNSKWRSVGAENTEPVRLEDTQMDDVDGSAMLDEADVDGMAMEEDGTVDDNINGVPMLDSSDEEMMDAEDDEAEHAEPPSAPRDPCPARPPPPSVERIPAKRQRARAVDMFGDDSD